MSHFVVTDRGIILNRTAAAQGRVPLAAWDIGSVHDNSFLSAHPDTPRINPENEHKLQAIEGKWEICRGEIPAQLLVKSSGVTLGQVNRRAAAMLAPLLDGKLIEVEFQHNQDAEGRSGRALYVFAKLGIEGNQQIIREPSSTSEMRAYVALLACSMKALKAVEHNLDREQSDSDSAGKDGAGGSDEDSDDLATSSWQKLPGAVQWDFATGSVGNTVNQDLINQLGSRTLAALQQSGAPIVTKESFAIRR